MEQSPPFGLGRSIKYDNSCDKKNQQVLRLFYG
uniref:Uncharacterized protein n=1 Tax=Arundo donax TaxID=35708 RepID=A0A0A8Y6W3_ARUDO